MSPIPTITLAQCHATPPSAGAPPSDKPTTSPGISGQTAPLAPVASSPQKILSPEQLEAKARKAVDAFLEEKFNSDLSDVHLALVRKLKNSAICATEENLARQRQLIPPDLEKISEALRLERMAQETMQGRAEAGHYIVEKKFPALFVIEQNLKEAHC